MIRAREFYEGSRTYFVSVRGDEVRQESNPVLGEVVPPPSKASEWLTKAYGASLKSFTNPDGYFWYRSIVTNEAGMFDHYHYVAIPKDF